MNRKKQRSTLPPVATKRRNLQHLTDQAGTRLFESCLPPHWVVRPYRPDYGLDFSIEIFKPVQSLRSQHKTFETMGEHLFVQLKSTNSARTRSRTLYSRYNVEKKREILDESDLVGVLDVAVQPLESSELATIERMGVGAPVLLILADLASQRCYFVCVNDYIDKILVPRFGLGATSRTRSLDVPTANVLERGGKHERALRWYGKRAKLYAAFQRFTFQNGNLEAQHDAAAVIEMARNFATRIAHYDFWNDTELWTPIARFGEAVRRFLETGDAVALRLEPGITRYERSRADAALPEVPAADILRLWKLLALLPSTYEDVCREWFLPTALGYLTSYTDRPRVDSVESTLSRPNV